jgi:murein L,D-transpeptidase YcbB/YkuD
LASAPDLAPAYAAHGSRPFWIVKGHATPAARSLVADLADAGRDGLDPARYAPAALAADLASAPRSSAQQQASIELRLSRAFQRYVSDLHTPAPAAAMSFIDPALAREFRVAQDPLLDLARAKSTDAGLARAVRMNPIYQAFRARIPQSGLPEPLLMANLERARALPGDLGREYVLVDAAAQRLWLYDDGAYRDSMKVVVGKPSSQTPMMAGLIRYAVFNPYWNVPPDLTRYKFAPRIAANPATLAALRLQVLTDSGPDALALDPAGVDWRSVADGSRSVWLRQLPGPDNMMGRVKLMLPNRLGIYLHDTPLRSLFEPATRTFSSGCVRLEDAHRLADRLLRSAKPPLEAGPEARIDLPAAVPVYITYFTVDPGFEGGAARHDVYGRDAPLLAQLAARAPAKPA